MTTAVALKEQGIDLVAENNRNWIDSIKEVFEKHFPPVEFAADDFRDYMLAAGVGEPSNPNCWGAVLNNLSRAKSIYAVGLRPHRHKSSHARRVTVWRKK